MIKNEKCELQKILIQVRGKFKDYTTTRVIKSDLKQLYNTEVDNKVGEREKNKKKRSYLLSGIPE